MTGSSVHNLTTFCRVLKISAKEKASLL